jgi:ubiquinone/menaquinone biosynthesis C-methylase UbiE
MLVKEILCRIASPGVSFLQSTLNAVWRFRVAQKFPREMPLVRTASVLEIGCGNGHLTERLARIVTQGKVAGVDSSERRIRRAMRRCVDLENVAFHVGSPEELPWETDSFDYVTCLDSFCEYPNPGRTLTEMRRVLKQGGKLFLGVHRLPVKNGETTAGRSLLNFVRNGYSPEQYVRYFEHSGFLNVVQKPGSNYLLTVGTKA